MQQHLSPEQYIRQKARTLPIDKCYISLGGLDMGMANILVTRMRPSGNRVLAMFLVDPYCLGVKNVMVHANITPEEWEVNAEQLDLENAFEEISYPEAHNMIYGAVEFAEEAGIRPHRDFALASYILEDDDNEDIPFIDYTFGQDGKHCLVTYPGEDLSRYVAAMKKNLEPGQFEVIEAGSIFHHEIKNDDAPEEPFMYDYPEYPKSVTLKHPELEQMLSAAYTKSLLPAEVLSHIAGLPREEVATDINSLMLREIGRIQPSLSDGDEPEDVSDLMMHCVILLSRFGGPEAWPAIKELLHQDDDMHEFCLGDMFDEAMPAAIVACIDGNIDLLIDLLWTPGLNLFSRNALIISLWLIAEQWPERRQAIIDLASELYESFFSRVPALDGADTHFAAFATCLASQLKADELLPPVERLYEADLIDEGVNGPYDDFVEFFGQDDISLYTMSVEDRYERIASTYNAEASDFQL